MIDIYFILKMLSVSSHDSAHRNDAGYLIDENIFKTTVILLLYWFAIQKGYGLFLLTKIHKFKKTFICVLSYLPENCQHKT